MTFLRCCSPPNKQVLFLLFLQLVATVIGNASAFTTSLTTKQSTKLPFQTTSAASKWNPIPHSVALRSPCSTKSKLTSSISIPTSPGAAGRRRALFQSPQQQQDSTSKQSVMRSVLQRLCLWWNTWKRSIRRAVVIVMASALIWTSTAGTYTPPASASSSSNVIERILPSSSQEQIVDKYTRQHMFDTDDAAMADPLESAYREAFSDYETDGSYPRALKEVMADVLGKRVAVGKKAAEGNGGFLGAIQGAIRLVERGAGVSEATALKVVGGTLVVTIPSALVLFALSLAQQSKRSMNRLMKERYGASYTVDATIREEPDEEAPDDENDDDDSDKGDKK